MERKRHIYGVVIADDRVQDLACRHCGSSWDDAIAGRVGCEEGLTPRPDKSEMWDPIRRAIPHAPMRGL